MAKSIAHHSPLLIRIMARWADLQFQEQFIHRTKFGADVYGLWEPNGIITVNPIPHVVNTLLHETLHELNPEWSERAVRSMVGKLQRQLTEEEEITIYNEYRRRVDGE